MREAIQGAIDPRDPLHNKTEMRLKWRDRPRRNMLPADWDEVLPHGLTTGGPTDIHPSGRREFTVRETMELQRFRPEHKLPGDLCLGKKREIVGNAVPRDIIRLIYKDFYDVLRATDQKIEKYRNVNLDGDDQASFPHTVPARASVGSRAKRKARASPSDSVTLCDSDEEMTDALASSPAIHTEPRKKVTMSQHSMIRSSGFPTAPTFKQEAGREPSGPGSFTAHRRPRKEQHGTIQSWNAKAKARAMSESEDELPDLPTFSGTPRRPRKKPRTMDDGFGVPKASASTSTPTPTPTPTPQGRAARPSWSAVVVDLTDD